MTAKTYSAPTITQMIHRRAWEMMSDGRWYNYEQVVLELGKVIPPGMALRRAEQRWKTGANTPSRTARRGGVARTERYQERTNAQLIARGRRDWVVATIQSRPYRGRTAYEFDPPATNTAGRNAHNRAEHLGRRVRINHPNALIRGDQRRAEWIRPVLNHLASVMLKKGDRWAAGQVQLAAHEQGFHLAMCPEGCVLNPNVQLDPLE